MSETVYSRLTQLQPNINDEIRKIHLIGFFGYILSFTRGENYGILRVVKIYIVVIIRKSFFIFWVLCLL